MRTHRSNHGWLELVAMAAVGLCFAGIAPAEGRDAQQRMQDFQPQSGSGLDRVASAVGVQNLAPADRRFLNHALSHGIAGLREVALAERQAASPDVRRAGEQLQQTHTLANTELQRIAAAHGVVPPKTPAEDSLGRYSRLRSLTGANFDKEFLRSQIAACTQSIQIYQHAQLESSNRTVKTFVSKMLPKLKGQLAMLETAQAKGNAAAPRQSSGSALNEPVKQQAGEPIDQQAQ